MYANLTFQLTLVSNKHSSPCYFNEITIGTAFRFFSWGNCAKIVVNMEIVTHKTHENQYPGLVLNFGFTANVDQKLPLKCHIFIIGNTHRRYCITSAIVRLMRGVLVLNYLLLLYKMISFTQSYILCRVEQKRYIPYMSNTHFITCIKGSQLGAFCP